MSKPPGGKRLRVLLAVLCYVLLGVPVWWATTSLHRPRLSHEDMQAILTQVRQSHTVLPVSLELYIVLPDAQAVEPQQRSPETWLSAFVQHLPTQHLKDAVQQGGLQLSVTIEDPATKGCTSAQVNGTGTSAATAVAAAGICLDLHAHPLCPGSPARPQGQGLAEATHLLDVALHDLLLQHDRGSPGRYTLLLFPEQLLLQEVDGAAACAAAVAAAGGHGAGGPLAGLTVGEFRHAWAAVPGGKGEGSSSSSWGQELSAAAGAAAGQLLDGFFSLRTDGAAMEAAGQLPVSPAGQLTLCFSLLNADPQGGLFDWDFPGFQARYLEPLAAALAAVAQVEAESQVLLYTRAAVKGRWSEQHRAHVVPYDQLPFFIDSEWPVESSGAVTRPYRISNSSTSSGRSSGPGAIQQQQELQQTRRAQVGAFQRQQQQQQEGQGAEVDTGAAVLPHVLHFAVYIPPPDQRPLLLLNQGGEPSRTNSFWIPSWGGLAVLNPGEGSAEEAKGGSVLPGAQQLCREQQQAVAGILVAQLHELMGLPMYHFVGGIGRGPVGLEQWQVVPAVGRGFTSWELDALVRQQVAQGLMGAARVMSSLSTLVQELPNLEMPDVIGEQVAAALSAIHEALREVQAGRYLAAAAAAQAARAAAESAFLHPAVLAQLNFPESHKLGVYMPLFLPVTVPLLQGVLFELLRFVRQKKAARFRAPPAR